MTTNSVDDLRELITGSQRIYEGRVIGLRVDEVRLPDGTPARREVVEHRGAVAIVPLLPGPTVALVRQWRHAVGRALVELPAGTLDRSEDPLQCARRELAEEVGLTAERLEPLISICSAPGFLEEVVHVFLARDLQPAPGNTDEDERIQPLQVDWNEAVAMCLDGRIADAKSVAGILAADRMMRVEEGRQQ